ncbi:MAG: DUF4190 domain-containing protein [Candidatus Andersenbacteria bacterium]
MAQNSVKKTGMNGMAIASFILSLVGLGVIGIILGFVALNQIKKEGGEGRGFAIAGIIIGFIGVALIIIWLIFFFWVFNTATNIIQSPLYNGEVQNALDSLNNVQFNFQ